MRELSFEETSAILAGLRLIQTTRDRGEDLPPEIKDILTDCDAIEAIGVDEIDVLCEDINVMPLSLGGVEEADMQHAIEDALAFYAAPESYAGQMRIVGEYPGEPEYEVPVWEDMGRQARDVLGLMGKQHGI